VEEMIRIVTVCMMSCCLWSLSTFVYSQQSNFALLPDHELQPASLIDVAPRYPHAIIAELSTGKLYIYQRQEDNNFLLLDTMETSIGKSGFGKNTEGDNKTPVGVYRIISHLTPVQLDDFYGHAAYPVNYTNAWDKLKERTGFGIWLHAEPIGFTEKTRPMLDSNGCIVLSNNDIDKINQYIDIGYTYIVMTPKIKMVAVKKIQKLRSNLHKRLNEWQAAWESLQFEPYLAFYSRQFSNLEKDWGEWVKYKIRVNKNKKFIDIGISDIGIYAYPGEEGMVWVEYFQTYRSSNYQSTGWKRQLWKLELDDVWRIIYEGGG
jgi:murein L,D-transpeptidase YafK